MGHIRVGRLPRGKTWRKVFESLENNFVDPVIVAKVTAEAAQERLALLQSNRQINFCFWTLIRIAEAAKKKEFSEELSNLGIDPKKITSGLAFIHQISQIVEKKIIEIDKQSIFTDFAKSSLTEILTNTVISQSGSLFGSDIETVRRACLTFSTKDGFGHIAKQFYARFLTKIVKFLVDKEISNHIGSGHSFTSSKQILDFHASLDRHCLETAKIIEEFASGWYSKNNWKHNNLIPEEAALGFTAYAIEKIRIQLQEGRR